MEPWGPFGAHERPRCAAAWREAQFTLVPMSSKEGPEKGSALKKAKSAPQGHGAEVWRLLVSEYEPKARRRYQAMLSNLLRVELHDPLGESLDNFERMVKQYTDASGKENQMRSLRRRS